MAQATAFNYQGYLLAARTDLQQRMSARFGDKAGPRMVELAEALSAAGRIADEAQRVERINQIMNRARYVTDPQLWQSEDYWATPAEFIALAAGDCEDYSLAKYFALRELGMPADKLRITYVRLLRQGRLENHMVLAYYPEPDAEPWVLDNLEKRFLPARERPDLTPVYSFNDDRVWKVQTGGDRELGSPQQLRKWRELLDKVRAEVKE
ncbi:transglutaminase-like cysteine peptidase [Methyloversatilis thermotolerans]|uniref:transglutaminase-like cysteine peptidase n=1 Tax=Methyloversatilis thermotolerans TaxID=1346290 RepID=UPI000363DD0D|nr:transglutaminase-like cysteine peptidase [Methyloversatilis thermotolerans]